MESSNTNLVESLKLLLPLLSGGLAGSILTFFLNRFQAVKRRIEYQTSSTPLLRFRPMSDRPINVTVDKSILTGHDDDRGHQESIQSAYAFSITMKNMGNDTGEPVDFDIDFDKDTKILQSSASIEERQDSNIQPNRDVNLSHRLKLTVPYLNRDEYLYVSVLTTGNSDAKFCQVNGRGKGIRVQPHR